MQDFGRSCGSGAPGDSGSQSQFDGFYPSRENEIEQAEFETRIRRYILELMQPTIKRTTHLENQQAELHAMVGKMQTKAPPELASHSRAASQAVHMLHLQRHRSSPRADVEAMAWAAGGLPHPIMEYLRISHLFVDSKLVAFSCLRRLCTDLLLRARHG